MKSDIRKLSKKTGLAFNTLYDRYMKGDRGAELVRPPHSPEIIMGKTVAEWLTSMEGAKPGCCHSAGQIRGYFSYWGKLGKTREYALCRFLKNNGFHSLIPKEFTS